MIAVARVSQLLVKLHGRWLNPPEWVEWVKEPVAGYPKRAVPTKAAPVRELRRRTLTDLYNEWPQWLEDAHANLDAAVAKAYGLLPSTSDECLLQNLLTLNQARHS